MEEKKGDDRRLLDGHPILIPILRPFPFPNGNTVIVALQGCAARRSTPDGGLQRGWTSWLLGGGLLRGRTGRLLTASQPPATDRRRRRRLFGRLPCEEAGQCPIQGECSKLLLQNMKIMFTGIVLFNGMCLRLVSIIATCRKFRNYCSIGSPCQIAFMDN